MTSPRIRRRPAIAWLAVCLFAGLLIDSIIADSQELGPENRQLLEKCMKANGRSVEHLAVKQRNAALTRICTALIFHDKGPHASLKEQILDAALAETEHQRTRRSLEDQSDVDELEKRVGQNRMLHFGKRDFDYEGQLPEDDDQQLDPLIKRAGQERFMHFGKRAPNRFMHFGKREPNRFMHFGKRLSDGLDYKRADRFMHFGKRDYDKGDTAPLANLDEEEIDDPERDLIKRTPNGRFMHFGKRQSSDGDITVDGVMDPQGILKRSPSNDRYLHFGKKAANKFMHFGKRQLVTQVADQKERKRRSVMSPLDVDGSGSSDDFEVLRPQASKRFSLACSSLPMRQAILKHKLNALEKEDLNTDEGLLQSDNSPLDRVVRSERYQMVRPNFQSRLTRPDRNIFLHFG